MATEQKNAQGAQAAQPADQSTPKNVINNGDSAAQVAANAAQNQNPTAADATVNASTDGTTTDMTSQTASTTGAAASSGSSMDVKTDGGTKKVSIGFGLSGYKSIVQKNGTGGSASSAGGGSFGGSGGFAEGDIKWLISVFGCGETGNKGFTQCEWNVSGDKHGWTVGGWSITQKGNFKRLGEEYMPKAGFPADICQQIANADFGNRTQSDSDKGPIEALVSRLTNKSGTDAQGEDVQKFVKATSDMFAHTWYLSAITLLNNLGIKTRLGMATVIRAIGWTGGDMNALVNKPTILLHAARKITAEHGGYDEMARNLMALGDEEKEKKFIQMFWEGHKDTCAVLFGKTSGHGWINEANDYLKYLQEGNLNPDSMSILGNNITYGQLLSSYAPYESIFMPIFTSVGSPPGTGGSGFGDLGEVQMNGDVPVWPTQAEIRKNNSVFGPHEAAGSNLVPVTTPYPLYVGGKRTNTIKCHKVVAPYVDKILKEVLQVYGAERIHALKMDVYDGCYNHRQIRGGSSWSMHAWGIAFDWNAGENGMTTHAPNATNSRKEWKQFWQIWEKYGAQSQGRYKDNDWMHVQFGRYSSSYPGAAGQKQNML